MSGKEGTFLICSFWLVSALAIVGEGQRAQDLMEKLLRVGSPLGLYAEEFEVDTGLPTGAPGTPSPPKLQLHKTETLPFVASDALTPHVKVTIYITDRAYREAVYQVVGKWLKGVFPVSTGIIVQGLARPEYLMEIDIVAVVPE